MGEGREVSGTSNGQRDHHRGNLTSIAITIIIAIMMIIIMITIIISIIMMIRQEARASGASTTISCRAGRGAEKHTLLIQARAVQDSLI